MSLEPVLVSIQQPVRVGDGAGGKAKSFVTVATGYATQNYYRKTSLDRLEQGAHNSQGPGVETQTRQFFTFDDKPFPTIAQGWRIVPPSGKAFNVRFVRFYDDTMQVDAELVA